MRQITFAASIAAIVLLLASCGGGGGSGPATTPQQPEQPPPPEQPVDTDGDGVPDAQDAFPNDASETVDSDGDGVGDNADAFPRNAAETMDSDGDGIGDNSDAFPNDPAETADSDSDGVGDNRDAFPQDASETMDSDGDGVGDNTDAFPNDPTETADSDGDGIGDNTDTHNVANDRDNDGVADADDAFPGDSTETRDSDSDGVGDNADAFPFDGAETADADMDGVGDNADAFPADPSETADSDGDGVGDNADAYPHDASRTAEVQRLPFPFQRYQAGTGPNDRPPHYYIGNLPNNRASSVKHMPVQTDGVWYDSFTFNGITTTIRHNTPQVSVFVGTDQGNIGNLPVSAIRGDSKIRFGTLNDGVGRSSLVDYLRTFYNRNLNTRWSSSPTVRLIGPASSYQEGIVAATVRLMNSALPEKHKLSMGTALPSDAPDDMANTITVRFVPSTPRPGVAGTTRNAREGAELVNSYIEIYDSAQYRLESNLTQRSQVLLLAHEMMHALGLDGGHPSSRYASVLLQGNYDTEINGQEQPLSLMWPVDREALRALYSLAPDADPSSLGPWNRTSVHIHGNGPHAGFGVALRNGYAEPWAYGKLPNTDLSQNAALPGSATWSGELLGFSGRAPVAGDAEIGVTLATMTGRADFTSLETWAAGAAPGAEGSGTTWLDGDLGYAIAVTGNTFRETGGDDGRLTGIFTGTGHEGAAGTLERSDLTAAFGASR